MNARALIYQGAAAAALLAGVVLYLVDRPPGSVYFLPVPSPYPFETGAVFGILGDWLPTFLHVYAFILLTVCAAGPGAHRVVPICMTWFAVDTLFELGQIPAIARMISALVPDAFMGIPFLENTAGYFLTGTFDVLDLVSIAAGTVAAYLTISLLTRKDST